MVVASLVIIPEVISSNKVNVYHPVLQTNIMILLNKFAWIVQNSIKIVQLAQNNVKNIFY